MDYQSILATYDAHIAERSAKNLPPKPLVVEQVHAVIAGFENSPELAQRQKLLSILLTQVSPGASEEADLKADFLNSIATGKLSAGELLSKEQAVAELGKMQCGRAVDHLVASLENPELAESARHELSGMALIYNALDRVDQLRLNGNIQGDQLMRDWAKASWFTNKPEVPEAIRVVLLKLDSAPTTDGLSPAPAAPTRTDIPLHAQRMLTPEIREQITVLKQQHPDTQVALFADNGMFGAGSSRLSATNSVAWTTGKDIDGVPAKKYAPIILSREGFAPIFQRAMRSDGGFAITTNTASFHTGDELVIRPHEGKILKDGVEAGTFTITAADLEKVRAGSATFLNTGKTLTAKAAQKLGMSPPDMFAKSERSGQTGGQTMAEKILSRAAGEPVYAGDQGVVAKVNLVGSQDTTGGMTSQEMKALGVTHISGDVTMLQSQCHNAGLPTADVIAANQRLIEYMREKGAVTLQLGDGVIHSWLNKMNSSPWDVTVGGDSHTRNSLGIAFGADSQTVAYAAATGTLILDKVPETVKVAVEGELPDGVTYRDVVNAIALEGRKQNNGKNPYENRVIEMHGVGGLDPEIAFAFSDATAERNAIASVTVFDKDTLIRGVSENLRFVKEMIAREYDNDGALTKLSGLMEHFLQNPEVPAPDADAKYAKEIRIDLSKLKEPLVSDPRKNPDDADNVRPLSELGAENIKIDEVFVGSCMTTAEDFSLVAKVLRNFQTRHPGEAIKAKLWVAPPRPDIREALIQTGDWQTFKEFAAPEGVQAAETQTGISLENPGCSLCMGNQIRSRPGANMLSTSTRPYRNRMGDGAMVYLSSPAVAAIGAIVGHIPTMQEYNELMEGVEIKFGRPNTNVLEVSRSSQVPITTGPVKELQIGD